MTATTFTNDLFGLLSGKTQRCSITLTGYVTLPPGCYILAAKSACLVKGLVDIYDEDGKLLYSSSTSDKRFSFSRETARALNCVCHSHVLFWCPETVSGGASQVPGTLLLPYSFPSRGSVRSQGWFNSSDSIWKITGTQFGLFPVPAFTEAAPIFTGSVGTQAVTSPGSATVVPGGSASLAFGSALSTGGLDVMISFNNPGITVGAIQIDVSTDSANRKLIFEFESPAGSYNLLLRTVSLPGMDRIVLWNRGGVNNLVAASVAVAMITDQVTLQLLEDVVVGVP